MKRMTWLVTSLALAGCAQVEQLQQARAAEKRVEAFVALEERVISLAPTAFDAMPTRGSARFDGSATLEITPSNGSSVLNILGDAALTADFGASTVVGEVRNMRGASGTTESNAKLFDVTGRILIGRDDSQIGTGDGMRRPNDWRADFRGDLTTPSRGDWRVDGVLEGQFRGTIPNAARTPGAVRGISGSAVSGDAFRGDSVNALTFEVYAQPAQGG